MRAKFFLWSVVGVVCICLAFTVLGWAQPTPNSVATLTPTPNAITRLTQDSSTDLRPVFSPDNRFIAFQSNRDGNNYHIYLMTADGSQVRALTSGERDDRRPVWTPDGKFVLFDSFDGEQEEIWSVNIANGSLKQITHVGELASFATVSADGKWLAFYVYKDNTLNLWISHADGAEAHPLIQSLASNTDNQCTFACHQAAWSPDSQWLAYTGGDGKSIWMISADGKRTRCIVQDEETNHFPWFLADGRLAYITEYVPPRYGGAWTNAWSYDPKTGQRSLIREFMALQGPVDWNADGSQILFHSPRAGNFDAYLINLNTLSGLSILQGTPVAPEPGLSK